MKESYTPSPYHMISPQGVLVLGLASQTCHYLPFVDDKKHFIAHKPLHLFRFLKDHHIPLAGSCQGEGVCKTCCLTSGRSFSFLSCQIPLPLPLYLPWFYRPRYLIVSPSSSKRSLHQTHSSLWVIQVEIPYF